MVGEVNVMRIGEFGKLVKVRGKYAFLRNLVILPCLESSLVLHCAENIEDFSSIS